MRLFVRQDDFAAFARQARLHQAGRAGGAKDLLVWRHVVEMRVRNETARHRKVRIKPPADLRKIDAVLEFDLPRHPRTETAVPQKSKEATPTGLGREIFPANK